MVRKDYIIIVTKNFSPVPVVVTFSYRYQHQRSAREEDWEELGAARLLWAKFLYCPILHSSAVHCLATRKQQKKVYILTPVLLFLRLFYLRPTGIMKYWVVGQYQPRFHDAVIRSSVVVCEW